GPETVGPVTLRWVHRDGHLVWTEQRIVVVKDQAGKTVAVEGIARDITERRRREERERFLAEASRQLAGSLDYEATLQGVARLAVPLLADWCAAHVLAEDGEIRLLTVAHADPSRVAWAR